MVMITRSFKFYTRKKMIEKITNWIRNYADKAGIETLVVGVSGGIDSAVVERLCERTGLCTVAVAMPMWMHRDSDPTSLHRAMELCVARPNVEFHVRPIEAIVQAYKAAGVSVHLNGATEQLCEGNLRSRIRANILYDFAGAKRGIVVGTGNKDEDEIGYFTKGGDGLVDICPLSKIHKSQVREMAVALSVPQSILEIAPTAGLWDGQTDESELGMTYDEVEWALRYDEGPDCSNLRTERQIEILTKVRQMRIRNAHKLAYPPIFDPAVISQEGAGEAA